MALKQSLTYRRLKELLRQLDFEGTEREDESIAYRHSGAGSVILLPAKRGDVAAREADLISVRMHLVGRGHVDESEFEAFLKQGVLPAGTG